MTVIEYAKDVNRYLSEPNLSSPPRCRTCSHWNMYPENKDLGSCAAMGVINFGDNAAIVCRPCGSPTSDKLAVRTMAGFGCVAHSNFLQNQIGSF
jgi:hypothetical protein